MRYKIVTGKDVGELEEKVNKELDQGWEIFGNLTIFNNLLIQSIIEVAPIKRSNSVVYKDGISKWSKNKDN